jgi:hypothetical protein
MKTFLLPFFLLTAVLLGWAQTPSSNKSTPTQKKPVSPFADYAGQWRATLDGQVWLQLTLELQGEQFTGSLVHPRNITLNDNGEVKSISEEQSTETVTEAVVNPDGLLITLKDRDTQETDRYVMKLVEPTKDAADLKIIGQAMPPGMPKPKPWRVRKANAAPTAR